MVDINKSEFYNKTKKSYNAIANSYTSQYYSIVSMEDALKEFTSYLSLGDKVLDVGCGHGRDLEYFINSGLFATGIDNSQELLKIARQRSEAELIELDIRNLSLLKQKFNGLWANAVLHHLHIDDIEKVCVDMFELLTDGGVLFISVKAKITDHWDSKYPNFPRHYTSIEKTFLENCLYSAGFKITKSKIIAEDISNPGLTRFWLNIFAST